MRCPKRVLQSEISALRKIVAKYLSYLAGEFASPQIAGWAKCW